VPSDRNGYGKIEAFYNLQKIDMIEMESDYGEEHVSSYIFENSGNMWKMLLGKSRSTPSVLTMVTILCYLRSAKTARSS